MKRLAAFAGMARSMIRLRPLAVTTAMTFIHVASKEPTIDGAIDRLIQFIFAYAAVAWAMNTNTRLDRPDGAQK